MRAKRGYPLLRAAYVLFQVLGLLGAALAIVGMAVMALGLVLAYRPGAELGTVSATLMVLGVGGGALVASLLVYVVGGALEVLVDIEANTRRA